MLICNIDRATTWDRARTLRALLCNPGVCEMLELLAFLHKQNTIVEVGAGDQVFVRRTRWRRYVEEDRRSKLTGGDDL